MATFRNIENLFATPSLALLDFSRFVVIRKSVKKIMQKPFMMPSDSSTSGEDQTIVLDGLDIERVKGRKVCLVEDVISSGGSIRAACDLLEAVGAEVTVFATVLLRKGNFQDSHMIYLKEADVQKWTISFISSTLAV